MLRRSLPVVVGLLAVECLSIAGAAGIAAPNRFYAYYESVLGTRRFLDTSNLLLLPIVGPTSAHEGAAALVDTGSLSSSARAEGRRPFQDTGLAAQIVADSAVAAEMDTAGVRQQESRKSARQTAADSAVAAGKDTSGVRPGKAGKSVGPSLAESTAAHSSVSASANMRVGTISQEGRKAQSSADMSLDTTSAKGERASTSAGASSAGLGLGAESSAGRTDQLAGVSSQPGSSVSAGADQIALAAGEKPVTLLVKSAERSFTWIGREVTFLLTVKNTGNLAIENVRLVDTLIPGFRFLSSASGLTTTRTTDSSSILTCDLKGTLAPGDAAQVSFTAVLTSLDGAVSIP